MKQVHRITEHPAEFHLFDGLLEAFAVDVQRFQRVVVAFFLGHGQQVVRVAQVGADFFERVHDGFEGFFLAAQVLGAFRIVPDRRVFEFRVDLF